MKESWDDSDLRHRSTSSREGYYEESACHRRSIGGAGLALVLAVLPSKLALTQIFPELICSRVYGWFGNSHLTD